MKFFKIQYILLDLVIVFTALYFIPYDLKVYIHNLLSFNLSVKYDRVAYANASTNLDNELSHVDNSLNNIADNSNNIATNSNPFLYSTTTSLYMDEKYINDRYMDYIGEPNTLMQYIKVTNSCGPYYNGACLTIRSAPSDKAEILYKPRNGTILKVKNKINVNDIDWYEIAFDEWLLYPERLTNKAFIRADKVVTFFDIGVATRPSNTSGVASSTNNFTYKKKKILVDISDQTLFAYDGADLYLKAKVSTGINSMPTATGTFNIYRKTPTRYMQGPIPGVGEDYYDLPGVPWNMYFTADGAAIHGAYWHNSFGQRYSHGCVNLPPATAEKLYKWADVGTKIIVSE